MRPGAPSMQQGGCCDDALVDGGGVTAAADMPLLESTSRMSKNCGPIVENQLHVQHQLVALFGIVFHTDLIRCCANCGWVHSRTRRISIMGKT